MAPRFAAAKSHGFYGSVITKSASTRARPAQSDALETQSEWLHEGEWRVPHDVHFSWDDVSFVIAPEADWARREAEQYAVLDEIFAQYFEAMPVVTITAAGQLVQDDSGIWP